MTDASIFRPEAVAAHRELTTAGPPVRTTRLPRLTLLALALLVVACAVVVVAVPIPATTIGSGRTAAGGELTISLPVGTSPPAPGQTVRVHGTGTDAPSVVRRIDTVADAPVVTVDRPGATTGAGPVPVVVDLPGTTLAGVLTGLGR